MYTYVVETLCSSIMCTKEMNISTYTLFVAHFLPLQLTLKTVESHYRDSEPSEKLLNATLNTQVLSGKKLIMLPTEF